MNVTDGRLATTVSAGTTSSGVMTWLDIIPNDIGKLATLVGICLSLTLIIMHIRKMRQDAQEAELKQELLRARIHHLRSGRSDPYDE